MIFKALKYCWQKTALKYISSQSVPKPCLKSYLDSLKWPTCFLPIKIRKILSTLHLLYYISSIFIFCSVSRYRRKRKTGSKREITTKQEAILKGLEPGTSYVINVRAVNGKTRGDWSKPVNVKTRSRKKHSGSLTAVLPKNKNVK